ncbi:MAG: hypothetical protein K2N33_02095, partial [Clostridia bacterium]|nr:hypothetical protein [Clostridia bacterium]
MKNFLRFNRKNVATALCAFLCALLVAVSFGLLGGTKGRIADAQTSGTMSDANTIRLDELTLSDYATRQDGKVFNGAVLDKLYDALTGNYSTTATSHKTIADVKNSLGSSRAYGDSGRQVQLDPYKDAKDLYDLNNNKNIVLDFGGDEWTVTFLTTDANGDLIATLWLTDLYKDETTGNTVFTKMGWATSTTGAGNGGNQTSTYPGDMYSTSQARVETLNAGGMIATGASAAGSHAQSVNNHWAKFTMTNTQLAGSAKANQSLTDYITKPNDVMYQHYENWQYQWHTVSSNSSTYPLHNEALNTWNGTTGTSTAVTSQGWYSNFNYTGNALYDDWGNDYLWLPSLSETGRISYSSIDGAIGLWRTTYSKTANTGQTTHTPANNPNTNWQSVANNTEYAWLRTGDNSGAYAAGCLSGSGSNNYAYPSRV